MTMLPKKASQRTVGGGGGGSSSVDDYRRSKEGTTGSSAQWRSQHSSPRRSLTPSVNSSPQHTPVERAPTTHRQSIPSSPHSKDAHGSGNITSGSGGGANKDGVATSSLTSSKRHPSNHHSRGSSTLSKEFTETPLFMASPAPPIIPVRDSAKVSVDPHFPHNAVGSGAGASGEDGVKIESLSSSSSFQWGKSNNIKNGGMGSDFSIQVAQKMVSSSSFKIPQVGLTPSTTITAESKAMTHPSPGVSKESERVIPAKQGTRMELSSGGVSSVRATAATVEKPSYRTSTLTPQITASSGVPPAAPILTKTPVPDFGATYLNKMENEAAESIDPQICCPLQNQGNSCYFNSCVQLLANCPAFLYGLRNSAWSRSRKVCSGVQRAVKAGSMPPGQFFYEAMAQLFYAMEFHNFPSGQALSTEVALNSLGMVNPTFEGRSQQDAAEMLATVLGTMEDEGRTLVDIRTLTKSFEEDSIRMKNVKSALSREDSRVNSDEFLDEDAKSESIGTLEPVFSTASAGVGLDTSPSPKGQKAGARSGSIGGGNSNGFVVRTISFQEDITGAACSGSHHWTKLLELMQQINSENEMLESTAYQREQKKRQDSAEKNAGERKTSSVCGRSSSSRDTNSTTVLPPLKEQSPFVAPKLLFNDVTNAFTGYTVSVTKCHNCANVSRSMHTFQTMLLDIPTTEERMKTGSWKVYGGGSHSHQRRRNEDDGSSNVINTRSQSTTPDYDVGTPRPNSTPAAIRSYEAKHAERLPESPRHQHTASTSMTELGRNTTAAYAHTSNSYMPKGSARKGMWGGSFFHFFSSIKDKIFSKQLDEPRTLKECFHHHFMPFSFTGQNLYRCESCGEASEATKKEFIAHLPETLLVQMKRFESGTVFHSKKMDPVVFPVNWNPISASQSFNSLCRDEVLDLAEFIYPPLRHTYRSCNDEERDCEALAAASAQHKRSSSKMSSSGAAHGSMGSPHAASNSRQFHSRQSSGIPPVGSPLRASSVLQPQGPLQPVSTYSLVGVINHHGSLGGGHYTAYVVKTLPNGSKMWVLMNDEEHKNVSEKEVADSEEYILMYRQQPVVKRMTAEIRLTEMARYHLQVIGKRPCLTNGKPNVIPLSSSSNNLTRNNNVYISRSWLHKAAFLGDPGPIMNRICYCSPADQGKPIPIPGVPFHVMREQKMLPHVHLVPLEWFYVPISEEDYQAFYQYYGGNAWVSPNELQRLHDEQERYKTMISPLLQ